MKTIPNQIRSKLAEQFNLPQLSVESDELITEHSIPVNGPLALIVKELKIKVKIHAPDRKNGSAFWIASVASNYTHHGGGSNGIRRDFVAIVNDSLASNPDVLAVVGYEDYCHIRSATAKEIHAALKTKSEKVN